MATRLPDIEGASEHTCLDCVHFVDDPGLIESEFPGIPVFGSAYSSARGLAGICEERQRFMDPLPASYCRTFEERGGADPRTCRQRRA